MAVKETPSGKAARTARWAVTTTKVRIRRVKSRTRWQFVTFLGKARSESAGIIDLLAGPKDHRAPKVKAAKRGDALDIILIQVKGGSARMPTAGDLKRMELVAQQLNARHILIASWKKGSEAKFFSYEPKGGRKGGFMDRDG
jgi:hypothetical protein